MAQVDLGAARAHVLLDQRIDDVALELRGRHGTHVGEEVDLNRRVLGAEPSALLADAGDQLLHFRPALDLNRLGPALADGDGDDRVSDPDRREREQGAGDPRAHSPATAL